MGFLILSAVTLVVAMVVRASPFAGAAAPADPSVVGQFETFTENGVVQDYYQPPSPVIAVHMVLMRNGLVLALGPFKYQSAPYPATAYVYNPAPGAPNNGFVKEVDPPDNIFCSGIAELSDGTVVLVGGRLHDVKLAGPPLVFTFDPDTLTWTQQPDMPMGLFYPTSTELPNGDLISTSGGTEVGAYNQSIEVIKPGTPQVSEQTTPPIMDYDQLYPRQWVMPDGKVVSYETQDGFVIDTTNPNPQKWTSTPLPPSKFVHAGYGPGSALLAAGLSGPTKMVIFGGGTGDGMGTNNVEELDYANLAAGWKTLAPIPGPKRVHPNALLLPDGTVLLAGGNSQGTWGEPVHQELLYNPATDSWTGLASNDPTINRGYHSTAVLLPDGRVLMGGDNGPGDHGGRLEIYDPPYLFKGARPTITSAPSTVTWNSQFNVQTPSAIQTAVLMAPAAQTHSVDMTQRAVDLPFTKTANGIRLTTPSQNVAPPGSYMLFLVNAAGVPSVAAWVHVGGAAPVVTSLDTTSGPFSGGTSVTIHGTGFADVTGVKFGDAVTSFKVNSPTQITATSPVPVNFGGGQGLDVTVETAKSSSAPTPGDRFVYNGPYVTSVNGHYGPSTGGTTISVQGINFGPGDQVQIGGAPATSVKIVNSGTLTAVTPPGVGLADVQVTDPSSGHSSPAVLHSSYFDYAPNVNNGGQVDGPLAVTPAYGPSTGGTKVVISGNNFDEATGVFFGPAPATSWQVVSNSEISAVAPASADDLTYADVTVASPGGTSPVTVLDQYCWYDTATGHTASSCINVPTGGGD